MKKYYSTAFNFLFKIALVFILFLGANSSFGQNVGIGTTTPTNSFHVVRAPGNPNLDPLRIEDLRRTSTDTAFLVIDNSGVVRYLTISNLTATIFTNLDSLIVISMINNADTLFSSQSFSDSLRGFIFNNADTLFSNQPWLDSLAVLLKDSIDSDVDSLVISPLDSLYLYEDAEIYDVTGGVSVNTNVSAIHFTTGGIVDPGYTTTDSTIVVAKAGRYKITYRVTLEMIAGPVTSGGNRSEAEFNIFNNSVLVPGTLSSSYHRNTDASVTKANIVKVIDLAAGDEIKVMSEKTAGSGVLRTKANGSSLLTERL